jgi:hypothetical protein
MPYLPSPTYNPGVSPVPVLDASSGDPAAKKDPKSVASIGSNIQAMQDQAKADRAFDAPVKEGYSDKAESFADYESPWITKSQACKRIQGFTDMNMSSKPKPLPYLAAAIAFSAAALILSSFL